MIIDACDGCMNGAGISTHRFGELLIVRKAPPGYRHRFISIQLFNSIIMIETGRLIIGKLDFAVTIQIIIFVEPVPKLI
jgi:hypothetical protein